MHGKRPPVVGTLAFMAWSARQLLRMARRRGPEERPE
jgi:hypothetical protein